MAGEEPDRIQFIKSMHCRMSMHDPCSGGFSDPHHMGERGYGQRAHDDTAVSLCRKHHAAWHDANGVFRGWSKDERRAWADKQIAYARSLWKGYCASEF